MKYKPYSELIWADDSQLTDEEINRKRFCESIPDSVVSALAVRADNIANEVKRLEKERDEIIDFVNGCYWHYFLNNYDWQDLPRPFVGNTTKDGDAE